MSHLQNSTDDTVLNNVEHNGHDKNSYIDIDRFLTVLNRNIHQGRQLYHPISLFYYSFHYIYLPLNSYCIAYCFIEPDNTLMTISKTNRAEN